MKSVQYFFFLISAFCIFPSQTDQFWSETKALEHKSRGRRLIPASRGSCWVLPFLKDLQESFTKALGGLPPALLQFHTNESVPVLLQPLGKQSHPRSSSALYESIITVLAEDFSPGYSSSVPFAAIPRRRSQHVPGNSSSEPALQIPALGGQGAPEPPWRDSQHWDLSSAR